MLGPHRPLGARGGRSLLRVALAGRDLRVIRRIGGDPAVVVRRHGDARDGELRVRLVARRDLHVELSLAPDRDGTSRGQRRELDRPGRCGCWRPSAVLLHGPWWRGTGANGLRSRGGFVAHDDHALRVGRALCSTHVSSREPRCPSRARGVARHGSVRPAPAPRIRRVHDGRSAPHGGAGNRMGAQPCTSAKATHRRPSRAFARTSATGFAMRSGHVGRGRSSPW